MKIVDAGNGRLVIVNLDVNKRKFVAKCLVIAVLVLGIMAKWLGAILVPPILLLCFMIFGFAKGKVTEYIFDGSLRQLRLKRKSMFGTESLGNALPFVDLQRIIYRDASFRRSDKKLYQLVVTTASHNAMVIGATGDLELCKDAIRRINALLGREEASGTQNPETLSEDEENSLEE
jgi:hypothetical protein